LFFVFRGTLSESRFEPISRIASISLEDTTVSSRLFVWREVSREALKEVDSYVKGTGKCKKLSPKRALQILDYLQVRGNPLDFVYTAWLKKHSRATIYDGASAEEVLTQMLRSKKGGKKKVQEALETLAFSHRRLVNVSLSVQRKNRKYVDVKRKEDLHRRQERLNRAP